MTAENRGSRTRSLSADERQDILDYLARAAREDFRRGQPSVQTVVCVSCNRPLFNTVLTQGWVSCPCGVTFSLQRVLAVMSRA